jgi:hypothetical protein
MTWLCQTEIHQWHETLAAGKNFCVIAVSLKQRQHLVDASRPK